MSEDFSCLEAMLVGPKRVEARAPVSPDGTFRLTAPRGGWFQLCFGRAGRGAWVHGSGEGPSHEPRGHDQRQAGPDEGMSDESTGLEATGWAVVQNNQVLVATVSPTRRAAIINWLAVVPWIQVRNDWTDELIELTWTKASVAQRYPPIVTPVTIRTAIP